MAVVALLRPGLPRQPFDDVGWADAGMLQPLHALDNLHALGVAGEIAATRNSVNSRPSSTNRRLTRPRRCQREMIDRSWPT